LNSAGAILARLSGEGVEETSILPGNGARVFEIPMGSGILNQEGQCVDSSGGFWVLNREKRGGEEKWMVYYRSGVGLSPPLVSR
jgi:hypothetical protein